jgi:hypothetical protein
MIMQEHPSITCSINKSEFRKLIMAKGKAGVSASGASMSKYDIEVEARLTALEKAIADLAVKCEERAAGGSDERVDKMYHWFVENA